MPINDPIARAKVAPASLAFEGRRALSTAVIASEPVPDIINYQQYITQIVFNPFDSTAAKRIAAKESQRILRNVSDAELRAKQAISDWHRALEWDTDGDNFTFRSLSAAPGYPNSINLSNEILRCPGVQMTDPWKFYVPSDSVGVWHFDVAMFFRFSAVHRLTQARLTVYRSGTLWRDFDLTNSSFNDKQHIEECYLDGSFLLPMQAGDYVQFYLMLVDDGGGTHSGLLSGNTSYYGYVSGHRVSCEPSTWEAGNEYNINAPTTGRSFDNVP